MIKSSEISVVVQGAISQEFTPKVLKSIRKYLKNAEIILSTWEDSNVEGLDYDVLIENKDPGAEVLYPLWNQKHNLNRQIVSTQNGIKKTSRKYVLKIRTDISLTGATFLKYFGKFKTRCESLNILKERVLTCQYFTRRPEVFPFHPGDWVYFGLKEDIENIWNIPLAPEPETTKWFYSHELLEQHKIPNSPYSFFRHRYCAEQYIWSNFLRKYANLKFEHMWDITAENIELTNISFANNLVILSDKEFGIKFLKGSPGKEEDIYTFTTWLMLYKDYCDSTYKLPLKYKLLTDYKFCKYCDKFKKHLGFVILPFKGIFNWFSHLLSIFVYGFKLIFTFLMHYFRRGANNATRKNM